MISSGLPPEPAVRATVTPDDMRERIGSVALSAGA
jgi:hypothetical protein